MDRAEFIARLSAGGPTDPHCFDGTPGTRTEITDEIDFSSIRFNKSLTVRNAAFSDAVKLSNREFADSVVFESCTFKKPIQLDKTSLKNGLKFTDCVFGLADGDLSRSMVVLDDARIRGGLTFERTNVHGCLSARRLEISGDLSFAACSIEGKSRGEAVLDLGQSKIRGNIVFETGPPAPANAANAAVQRDPWPYRSTFVNRGGVSIRLRGSEITDLVALSYAHFIGGADLSFTTCRGLVSNSGFFTERQRDPSIPNRNQTEQAAPAQIIPDQKTLLWGERFAGARIEGDIILSGGEFGLIHLHGITILGTLTMIGGNSGQISIEDDFRPGIDESECFLTTSRLGNFIMAQWKCRDFLFLHPAQITGRASPSGFRGIAIRSSEIGQVVSLWPGALLQAALQKYLGKDHAQETLPKFFMAKPIDNPAATESERIATESILVAVETDQRCRNLLNRWRRQLIVYGNVLIDHCTTGDDLLLTGLDLVAVSAPDNGRIDVVDSKINGNLVFRSPISFLADAQVDAPLLRLIAQRLAVSLPPDVPVEDIQDISYEKYTERQNGFAFVPACCHVLDATGLHAVKIDLTGLCVRKPLKRDDLGVSPAASTVGKRDENPPNAVMSNVEVSAKIATFARLSNDAADDVFGKVRTYLDDIAAQSGKQLPGQLLTLCFGDVTGHISRRDAGLPASDKRFEASADIYGSLDLQHARIGELLISDTSFREHAPDEKPSERGIVLDYAEIRKLYVARSDSPAARAKHHNGFPVPLSLLDFTVKTWFLEDDESPRDDDESYIEHETTIAGPYLDLLENDTAFRMSSYLVVEQSLRDRGLTDEAREIFIAGAYRDVRTEGKKPALIETPEGRWALIVLAARLSQKWKQWRRGNGRRRQSMFREVVRVQNGKRDPLLVGLCALGAFFAVFSLGAFIASPSFAKLVFLAATTVYLFALHGRVCRLERPLREYFAFFLSTFWCAGVCYLIYSIYSSGLLLASTLVLVIVLSATGLMFYGALQIFVDHLYWSLVDYGTSAWRLACVIVVLMVASFALVSGDAHNFEPTLLAKSVNEAPQKTKWYEDGVPKYWPLGERLWMTLRFHVPLVGAVVSEEWEPADKPLNLVGAPLENTGAPSWWPVCWSWPRARDWYGAMLWLNWILWPLFLPFLIHKLSRER